MLTETVRGEEWREVRLLGTGKAVPRGLLKHSPYLEHQEWRPTELPRLKEIRVPIVHPTKLHEAVDSLFQVLGKKLPPSQVLGHASLLIYKSNFGLVVYKHPRPGVIHIYNKRFGGRPNVLVTEPLHMEELRRADNEFI